MPGWARQPARMGTLPLGRVAVWVAALCVAGVAQNPDRTGDCICDLTSVACDPNCCCDPDCVSGDDTYIVNLAFTRCKKEKYGARRGVLCTDPPVSLLEPYYINPMGSLEAVINSEEEYYQRKIVTRDSSVEKSQVCIVHDNVNLDGASYSPLLEPLSIQQLVAIEEESKLRDVWNFQREAPSTRWVMSGEEGINIMPGWWYRVGDKVSAARIAAKTTLPYLPIPRDVAGRCNDDIPAFFMENVLDPQPCTRVGSLEAMCPVELAISRWQGLGIVRPESTDTPGDVAQTAFPATVVLRDSAGQTISDTSTFTYYRNGICYNAVQRVDIEIDFKFRKPDQPERYETNAFRITLTLQEVSSLPFTQHHTLFWRPNSKTGDPVQRSGNPGYRRDALIRATATLEGGVPSEAVAPFTLPLGMHCDDAVRAPVKFLHNVVNTGCYIEMNITEFGDLCTKDTLLVEKAAGANTADAFERVAIYGNTADGEEKDWAPIRSRLGSPAALFDQVQRTCTFHVGYDYTFVIRRMGKVYNPQDILAGVLKDKVYSTWQFTNNEPGGKQRFQLRWRASFVRQGEVNIDKDAIEAPRLLPAVSDDIFYPFQIITSSRGEPVENSEL